MTTPWFPARWSAQVPAFEPPEPPPWYADYSEVLAFGHVLNDLDRFDTPGDVLYYLEKPHKWDGEHELWVGCNRPTDEDASWAWFLSKLEQNEEKER